MRALAPFLLCALSLSVSLARAADPFPALSAENLHSRTVALPDAVKGHPAVLIIGFTHASQTQMKTWAAALEPEMKPWSIAVLQDAPRLVRPMAVAGMKSGVPQDQRDRYLVLTRHEKELKTAAAFDRPDDAYIVLLDRAGAISWRFHGPLTDTAHAELKSQMATLDRN